MQEVSGPPIVVAPEGPSRADRNASRSANLDDIGTASGGLASVDSNDCDGSQTCDRKNDLLHDFPFFLSKKCSGKGDGLVGIVCAESYELHFSAVLPAFLPGWRGRLGSLLTNVRHLMSN